MSEEQGTEELTTRQACDERYSDGPVPTSAAGPERADEGGGPDAGGGFDGTNVLRNDS